MVVGGLKYGYGPALECCGSNAYQGIHRGAYRIVTLNKNVDLPGKKGIAGYIFYRYLDGVIGNTLINSIG